MACDITLNCERGDHEACHGYDKWCDSCLCDCHEPGSGVREPLEPEPEPPTLSASVTYGPGWPD